MKALANVNKLTEEAFVASFGDVAEHAPWVAREASKERPFAVRADMIRAFEAALHRASKEDQLALIRAHPDLAGKARLTADSAKEQEGAGLTALSQNEFDQFTALNTQYQAKFGFPFIFAVKGATTHQILASFTERLNNSLDTEFEMALRQVMRIFRFRIEGRVQP
jgi:2-oxo-4-hydroxy-4-carboxy-5-ureidoimidazoline decarboxylase